MSSKRSRKDGALSSSFVSYDKKLFVSEEAFKNYQVAIDKQKPWVPKMGFDLYMYASYDLMMDTIARWKWQHLCAHLNLAVTPIVREFYANVAVRYDFKTVVRGKENSYSEAAINSFYVLDTICQRVTGSKRRS